MPSYGLKLGIGEAVLARMAAELWLRRQFDFLELYIPLSARVEDAALWMWYDGVLFLHAPHSEGGFNFASASLQDSNRAVLEKITVFVQVMNPLRVIFHPGYDGSESECLRQIKDLRKKWPGLHQVMLLENKPRNALDGLTCLGASPADMKRLLDETNCGFCFDVRHAIAYAASAGLSWFDVIREFAQFAPMLWHAADGNLEDPLDSHLHFGDGNIDWSIIGTLLRSDTRVTIECKKKSAVNLDDFQKDSAWLRAVWGKEGV